MYSFWVGDDSEHESVKCVNKIVDKKYLRVNAKNIFLNKSCLRHLMNRIQSKSSFFCFDDKIYAPNKGYDE